MPSAVEWVWIGAVLALTLTAMVFDVRWRRIPNWLTVSAFALGLAFQSATRGLDGLAAGLGGFGTGFGLLMVLWLVGAGGGGDVKLMGALGAWLGSQLTLYAMVSSAVFVAVGGSALLLWSLARRPAEPAAASTPEARKARRLMPFAVPLGLGTWCIVAWKVLSELHPS